MCTHSLKSYDGKRKSIIGYQVLIPKLLTDQYRSLFGFDAIDYPSKQKHKALWMPDGRSPVLKKYKGFHMFATKYAAKQFNTFMGTIQSVVVKVRGEKLNGKGLAYIDYVDGVHKDAVIYTCGERTILEEVA